jgi:hypothetical protein
MVRDAWYGVCSDVRRAIFSIGKTGTVKTIVLEEEYF